MEQVMVMLPPAVVTCGSRVLTFGNPEGEGGGVKIRGNFSHFELKRKSSYTLEASKYKFQLYKIIHQTNKLCTHN